MLQDQANWVSKNDFNKKLVRFNRKIIWDKTKKKKKNSLTTNDYNFFLGRIYFTSNYRPQNIFTYQPALDTLELKKIYILDWKSKEVFNSKLSHDIMLSYIGRNGMDKEWE